MNKDLIEKYLKGNSSIEESKHVEDWILKSDENMVFFNRIKTNYIIKTFEETSRDALVDKAYRNFQSRHINTSKLKKIDFGDIFKYAAVVFVILTSGYFFYNNWEDKKTVIISDNAITLELGDGTTKIIEENGASIILGHNGKVVGEQKGNQLVYETGLASKELVYNTLKIPYGKTFKLKLSDGTLVCLNAGSSIKYPVEFISGQERKIAITGEAFLDVAKDSLHPFVISLNEFNVRVLGTQFNVSAYPEDPVSEIVLVEGAVAMYKEIEGFNADKALLLEPSFKGSFNKKDLSITSEKVLTSTYTSWIKGELIFRNMTFGNILKKLERHYNVTVVNKNEDLTNKMFNANFGNEPLINVLNELQMYYGIQYKLLHNTLTIE